jgi:hypothetical protein
MDITGSEKVVQVNLFIAYHSPFIPEGVAEASQIFLGHAHVLPKLFSYELYCRRDTW